MEVAAQDFKASVPRIRGPRLVLVEECGNGSRLRIACDQVGIAPLPAKTVGEVCDGVRRLGARVVVVEFGSTCLSLRGLIASLQATSARIVLIGPRFGSSDHVAALDLGVDEVWPAGTSTPVLRALLRRAVGDWPQAESEANMRRLDVGPLVVDLDSLRCSYDGRPVVMTYLQLQILATMLYRYPGVVPREALREVVSSTTLRPSGDKSRSIDIHVSRLRRILGAAGAAGVSISSIRGYGYKIVRGETRVASA